MSMEASSPNSITGLLQSLRDDTTRLLRQEVALAKAELTEKTTRFTREAAMVAVAGFVAYAGAIVFLFALGDLLAYILTLMGLSEVMSLWLGRAIIGLIVIAVGWAMFNKAKRAMTHDRLVPDQTLQSLRDNKQWAQTKLQTSHGPTTN